MKAVIFIAGNNEGKNKFEEVVKSELRDNSKPSTEDNKRFWVWNVNPSNMISKDTESWGWDGVRDEKHQEFVKKIVELADNYYGFKFFYVNGMVEKFKAHNKANVLIIHSTDKKLQEKIMEESEAFSLYVGRDSVECNNFVDKFDKVIGLDSENFKEEVLMFLKTLVSDTGWICPTSYE
jgi:hypothetical protein